jgi:hypothetical protein
VEATWFATKASATTWASTMLDFPQPAKWSKPDAWYPGTLACGGHGSRTEPSPGAG